MIKLRVNCCCCCYKKQFAAQIKLGYLSCLKFYSLFKTMHMKVAIGLNIPLVNKFHYAINL